MYKDSDHWVHFQLAWCVTKMSLQMTYTQTMPNGTGHATSNLPLRNLKERKNDKPKNEKLTVANVERGRRNGHHKKASAKTVSFVEKVLARFIGAVHWNLTRM